MNWGSVIQLLLGGMGGKGAPGGGGWQQSIGSLLGVPGLLEQAMDKKPEHEEPGVGGPVADELTDMDDRAPEEYKEGQVPITWKRAFTRARGNTGNMPGAEGWGHMLGSTLASGIGNKISGLGGGGGGLLNGGKGSVDFWNGAKAGGGGWGSLLSKIGGFFRGI